MRRTNWPPLDVWDDPAGWGESPPKALVRRTRHRSPLHGGEVSIVTASRSPLPDDFDLLVKEAASFLGAFVPGAFVRLTYVDSADWQPQYVTAGSGIGAFTSGAGGSWLRTLDLHLHPAALRFLNKAESGPLPKELQLLESYTLGIGETLGRAVREGTGAAELRSAASTALPDLIVSMVAASAVLGLTAQEHRVEEMAKVIRSAIAEAARIGASPVEAEAQPFGVVIGARSGPGGTFPGRLGELKRVGALADGEDACLVLFANGSISGLKTGLPRRDELLERRAGLTKGVGVELRRDSTIRLSANGNAIAMRRNNRWVAALGSTFTEALTGRIGESLGALLPQVASILQALGHGGIVCVTPDYELNECDDVAKARTTPPSAGEPPHWALHRLLPSTAVSKLGLPYLARLASIDGALLLTPGCEVMSYGAIVKARSSGLEGGRTAAAKTLSLSGLTMKVSQDGPVSIWDKGEQVLEL